MFFKSRSNALLFLCWCRGLLLGCLLVVMLLVGLFGCGPSYFGGHVLGHRIPGYNTNNTVLVTNNIQDVVIRVEKASLQTGQKSVIQLEYYGHRHGRVELTLEVSDAYTGQYLGLAREQFDAPDGNRYGGRWLAPQVWVIDRFEPVRAVGRPSGRSGR